MADDRFAAHCADKMTPGTRKRSPKRFAAGRGYGVSGRLPVMLRSPE